MMEMDGINKSAEEERVNLHELFKNDPVALAEVEAIEKRLQDRKDDIRRRMGEIENIPEPDREDERNALAAEMLSAESEAGEARNQLLMDSILRLQDQIEEKKRKQEELKAKLNRLEELNKKLAPMKVNETRKIYPNDPCPCGSGKKYKKCCGY